MFYNKNGLHNAFIKSAVVQARSHGSYLSTNSTRLNGAETAVWNKNQTVSGDSVYLQKLVTA